MLKQRVVTALCLVPLAVAAIYFTSLPWFALIIAVAAALGVWEWAAFAGLRSRGARASYVVVWSLLVALTWYSPQLSQASLIAGLVLWIAAAVVVLTYPASASLLRRPVVAGVVGLIVLWSAWSAIVTIRSLPDGANWLLWGFVLVWGADIGAYFAGRAFGRHKLAPSVSPGKTWEGVAGGLLLAAIACGGALAWAQILDLAWVAVIILLVAVSVFGDLFESVMKRMSDIKDSGSLLPGHGGVLDRVDAVVAVMPLLALLLSEASALSY